MTCCCNGSSSVGVGQPRNPTPHSSLLLRSDNRWDRFNADLYVYFYDDTLDNRYMRFDTYGEWLTTISSPSFAPLHRNFMDIIHEYTGEAVAEATSLASTMSGWDGSNECYTEVALHSMDVGISTPTHDPVNTVYDVKNVHFTHDLRFILEKNVLASINTSSNRRHTIYNLGRGVVSFMGSLGWYACAVGFTPVFLYKTTCDDGNVYEETKPYDGSLTTSLRTVMGGIVYYKFNIDTGREYTIGQHIG